MASETIAHYRITSMLGRAAWEGLPGHGYCWAAVAIKVIPQLAQDAGRMARFTREAKVLASLNHPNIAAIYGVEDRALVMELVEGPTLAERIGAGRCRSGAWRLPDRWRMRWRRHTKRHCARD
jgi:serine/threonine-protein kinase